MIGEEKNSVAISGRSSHKMTGLISPRRTETVAAVSSRRGIFTALIGARRAFPIRNEQCMRPSLSQRRRYATEP